MSPGLNIGPLKYDSRYCMSRTVEMIQYESYSSSFNVLNVLTGDVFFWAAGEETGESEIGLIS